MVDKDRSEREWTGDLVGPSRYSSLHFETICREKPNVNLWGQGGLHEANEREHPFSFSFVKLQHYCWMDRVSFDMKGIPESLKTQLCLGQHMFVLQHIKIKDVKSKM